MHHALFFDQPAHDEAILRLKDAGEVAGALCIGLVSYGFLVVVNELVKWRVGFGMHDVVRETPTRVTSALQAPLTSHMRAPTASSHAHCDLGGQGGGELDHQNGRHSDRCRQPPQQSHAVLVPGADR